jgi:hypothetical protein
MFGNNSRMNVVAGETYRIQEAVISLIKQLKLAICEGNISSVFSTRFPL